MANQHEQITTFLNNWTNAERNGDTATLETMLTDGFAGVGPMGFILPKTAWLARHSSGDMTYESLDLDEVQVRSYGDVALVTARQTGKAAYQGNPVPGILRATLIVVNDNGASKLAGIHMSFIAGTPGAPAPPV